MAKEKLERRENMALDLTAMSVACTLLISIITFAFLRLKHWNVFENFRRIPSTISYLLSLWACGIRRRPKPTCVDEVDAYNQCASYQMTSSLSPSFSSSHASQIKYDVFISFRGSDTRRGFLSHLLKALSQEKIETYIDYKLREGNELLPALFTAIEESQIALIIFSKDYASSKWCLEELVKITECMMKNGQIVIPIFYNVDPSDVRHQKGCYKNAFAKHEKLSKGNIMNVEKWRATLKKVANLSGFHSINFGTEAELIEEVVQRALTRLSHMPQVDLNGLVGIDKPIADLQSLIFCNGSEDVRIIGIWGMGGIGKTTIAGALFNILRSEFEGCCFLANVREQLEKDGIYQLRDKLLSILLEEKDLNNDVPDGAPTHILRRLRRKKVIVVLDDVNKPDQVINLVGDKHYLGPGSRIIITSRDKHVISKADDIYEVKALEYHEALELLNLHAFNGKCHQMNWHKLMVKVVEYAKGIPLALKVLGSFLYDKSAKEWESQLQKLQKMPFPEILDVLRLSYGGLDREVRSIFLYIACFFNIDRKERIETFLDACGYSSTIALKILQDRALITIFGMGEYVSMHDLIQEMGREIVREQGIEKPGKRSHLWDPIDIYRVLKHEEGTEHVESINLDMSRISDLSLSPHSFARMVNLKFLKFYESNDSMFRCNGVHLPEGLRILPDKLVLFHWDYYLWKSLPATFNAENLVELRMQASHVEKLWDDVQNLTNLKKFDLDGSMQLIELPDLSKAPSLEKLSLKCCTNLLSVHPSIFTLQSLVEVTLEGCRRLERLPAIEALPSSERCRSKLEYLNLVRCENLKRLPDSMSELRFLTSLWLNGCKQLDTSNLHILFDGVSSLVELGLRGCRNLFEVPDNISNLSLLSELALTGSNVKSLPESIKHLSQLRYLYLSNCRRLQSLPELPASVCRLHASGCTSLERVFTPTPELLEEHIRLFESDPSEHYCTDFSLENCPNLDKDALDAILAYADCCSKGEQAVWKKCTGKKIRR